MRRQYMPVLSRHSRTCIEESYRLGRPARASDSAVKLPDVSRKSACGGGLIFRLRLSLGVLLLPDTFDISIISGTFLEVRFFRPPFCPKIEFGVHGGCRVGSTALDGIARHRQNLRARNASSSAQELGAFPSFVGGQRRESIVSGLISRRMIDFLAGDRRYG